MKKYFVLMIVCLFTIGMVLTGCDGGGGGGNGASHTISFVANGGSGSMASVVLEKDHEYIIQPCTFTGASATSKSDVACVNKCFGGWNTEPDGSGVDLAEGDKVMELEKDLTLYAQWYSPVFSVSSSKKVFFSKGNLRYTISTDKWSFFDKQYECGPASYSAGHNQEISLFTWGYDPSFSKVPDTNSFIIDPNPFVDWGTLFTGATWFTPSIDEWGYLLNTRECKTSGVAAGENARYAEVRVDDIKGLLIFPDTFTWTPEMGYSPADINNHYPGYLAGEYTVAQFEKIAAAGAVFLPAAGQRQAGTIYEAGETAEYFSSSKNGDSSEFSCLGFSDSAVNPNGFGFRYDGHAVRLVTEAE